MQDIIEIDGSQASCAACGERFDEDEDSLKQGLAVQEKSLENAGAHYVNPSRFITDEEEMVFREFYCPSCGKLIFTETSRKEDPPINDFQIETSY